MNKSIKVTFEISNDGLVANDCFHALASECSIKTKSDGIVVLNTGCEMRNEYDYIVLTGDDTAIDETIKIIMAGYSDYKPNVFLYESTFAAFARQHGYKFVNEAEPGYMRGEISNYDRQRISQGKTPFWAKTVKDNKPERMKRVRGSQSPSEVAMRSVNTTNGIEKGPYMETDWRRDKESHTEMNKNIAISLRRYLGDKMDSMSFDDRDASIRVGDELVFRVSAHQKGYRCVRFVATNVFDRKTAIKPTLKEIAKWIKENT